MPTQKPSKQPSGFLRQFAMATELPFILVGAVVIGGGIGYFLDEKLHTKPWLMLVFGLLGFGGGLREILRRLNPSDESGQSRRQNGSG